MNFINKINNYLIQRYPTIWNTRIVWMLAISLLVHILFYFIGYLSHTNPLSLQTSRVVDDYFSSGVIMVHIICSMLLLVGWLVYMFKNNGFKNFYPTSNFKLFGQFLCYLVIVFVSITFYFSYMVGFKTYINATYLDQDFKESVQKINKAYPFLSLKYQDYELDRKAYPKLFNDLYCETKTDLIDYSQKYYNSHGNKYQFYTLYKVGVTERDEYRKFKYPAKELSNNTPLAYSNVKGDTCFYYFKKDVVDVSAYTKSGDLSYYNFSEEFYTLDLNQIDYYDRYNDSYTVYADDQGYYGSDPNLGKSYAINKELTALLDRKNPEELKKILSDFLEVSQKYQIKTNLTTDKWFKLIYHPENFVVKHFIADHVNKYPQVTTTGVADTLSNNSEVVTTQNVTYYKEEVVEAVNENTEMYRYYQQNLTQNYYEIRNLSDFLQSVELVKNIDFVSRNIHIYIWIAFFLSTLIFSFRVTNLRSVIFTGLTTGVLSLVIGLIVLVYSMSFGANPEFFASYFIFILGTIILLIPIVFINSGSKLFTSVLMNISINGFVLYVFLILGIISMHQKQACYDKNYNYKINCTTLLEYLDMNTSYLLLAVGLLFIFIYTAVIKKWRAVPE